MATTVEELTYPKTFVPFRDEYCISKTAERLGDLKSFQAWEGSNWLPVMTPMITGR